MKNLISSDDKKVVDALDRADKNGDIKWVRPLVHAFRDREPDSIRERMGEMLSSMKISAAEDVFIEELESSGSKSIHSDLLRFIWSAGFLVEDKVDLVVRIATAGDFRAAMEGLTIVEQFESVEDELILLDAIMTVRTAVENNKDESLIALYKPMLEALLTLERAQ